MGVHKMKIYQEFFYQFMLVYRPFENQLNAILSRHQIQRAQWTVLFYLAKFESVTLVELSHYLGVEKPTTTRTVQRLQEQGYVEQMTSLDKREKRMRLTTSGEKVYHDIRLFVDQFEQEILQGIKEEELTGSIDVLKQIRTNLLKGE